MHPVIRNVGLALPAIRRVVRQRDELYLENIALKRQLAAEPTAPIGGGGRVGSLCTVVNPNHWLDREWLALHHG